MGTIHYGNVCYIYLSKVFLGKRLGCITRPMELWPLLLLFRIKWVDVISIISLAFNK
jgi:hypothetical protein